MGKPATRHSIAKTSAPTLAIVKKSEKGQVAAFQQFPIPKRGRVVEIQSNNISNAATSDAPLPFYAIVDISDTLRVPAKVRGLKGVIVGRAETKTGLWNYSVNVWGLGESFYLRHSVLKNTGTVMKKEDLYPGKTFKVRVNAEGNGVAVQIERPVVGGEETEAKEQNAKTNQGTGSSRAKSAAGRGSSV